MNRTGVPFYPVVMMHSGETVNIWTNYGANEFLKQCETTTKDDFNFFSLELKKADVIREKGKRKGKLNSANRQSLRDIYEKLAVIVDMCDVAPFREHVPEAETTAWLEHATAVFQGVSKDPHWIRSGNLLRHDEMLLTSCYNLLNHPAPVMKVLQDSSFFQSISALILANKEAFLNTPFYANSIVRIVGDVFACCVDVHRLDNPWPAETIFKKLEASGILAHFISCAAVKLDGEKIGDTKKSLTFDNLVRYVAFIKKKFKAGTPCGDSLRGILNGRMTVCPIALPFLQSVLKVSNSFEEAKAKPTPPRAEFCRYCNKVELQEKLMKCSRCRLEYYCSRECQVAHWKQHKPICHEDNRPSKNHKIVQEMLPRFAKDSFVDIMQRLVEESEKGGGLRMQDMLLQVDFRADKNGNIPILQEPPQFNVFSKSQFLQAKAERVVYSEEELEGLVAGLHHRLPSAGLICYTILPEGDKKFHRFNRMNPFTKEELYTEETLEACRSAFLEDNWVHLNVLLNGFFKRPCV